MAFVNLSLLVGGLLVGVPILLHLMMRQQPKHLLFPALRFLKERRETNRRLLRLRHWLLLLLRCLAIGLLALALARPSVASAALGSWVTMAALAVAALLAGLLAVVAAARGRGRVLTGVCAAVALCLMIAAGVFAQQALRAGSQAPIGDQQAPVAAVLVFDSSLRMDYRHENRTRLEQAKELALWLVRQLPPDSDVAVVDSRPQPLAFAVDRSAATHAISRLQSTAVNRPLPTVIEEALQLISTSPQQRKEIYVFTDLTAQAWSGPSGDELKRKLQPLEELLVYIVDVGVERPINIALGDIHLSSQVLTENSPLEIETSLEELGPGGARTVELHIEEPDVTRPVIRDGKTLLPPMRRRARQTYELAADSSQQIRFDVQGFPVGVHHGAIRVLAGDGLAIDDARYFTFRIQEAWPLLVVAPAGVNTFLFTEAVAPYELRQTGQAKFRCDVIAQDRLADQQLEQYAAVCLLDPQPLSSRSWDQLHQYVQAGGALALFLGNNAEPDAFSSEPAQRVMPGPLLRQWRSPDRDLFLAPQNYDHPVLAAYSAITTQVPWQAFPVFRHWQLGELATDAFVVLRLGNNQPAMVERAVGKGQVLMMTTPITEPARPEGRQPWNELAAANDWPRFMLLNQLLDYLVGAAAAPLNYSSGQDVVLPNDMQSDPRRYQLFTPQGELADVTAQDNELVLRFTDYPGIYRLKGARDGVVVRGFAVNLPVQATDLRPLPEERLDAILGEDRYQLARTPQELERVQGRQRTGRPFYPLLIVFVAALVGLEHLLANRFYPDDEVVV